MSKTPEDAFSLLQTMASNNYQWHGDRNQSRKTTRVYEIDGLNLVNAKLDSLTKKLEKINMVGHPSSVFSYEICGGGHSTIECQ